MILHTPAILAEVSWINNISRKFKQSEHYKVNASNEYYLLPFGFHKINSKNEVIVSELGDYLFAPNGTTEKIVKKKINANDDIYQDLVSF